MDWACSQTLLSGTYYSLCWRGINVWKFSQCWSQYIFLPPHSISPSAEDNCPWANAWLLKPCAGIQHSPMTPSCNRPNRCVSQLHVFMRKGVCIVFASKSPVSLCVDQRADEADLPCSGERQQVGVRALTKCFQSTESIWAETCLQTRYSI